jgi:hypothetical protein
VRDAEVKKRKEKAADKGPGNDQWFDFTGCNRRVECCPVLLLLVDGKVEGSSA